MTGNITFALVASTLALATPALAQTTTVYGNENEAISSVPRLATDLDVPTMQIRMRHGQTNTLFFMPNGNLRILVDATQTTVNARYSVEGDRVCVYLPVRGKDCWHYDAHATQGQVDAMTSDRGQKISATYLRPGRILEAQVAASDPAVMPPRP